MSSDSTGSQASLTHLGYSALTVDYLGVFSQKGERMKARLFISATSAAAACTATLADVKVFLLQEHFFHEPLAWSPPGIPTAQDRIVIPTNKNCFVNADATVDTVHIEAGGRLIVFGEGGTGVGTTLTLMNSIDNLGTGTPDNSLIDGRLEGDNANGGSFIAFEESHKLSGNGVVSLGAFSAPPPFGHPAKILIVNGRTLTNDLAVPGTGGVRGWFDVAPTGPDHAMPAFFHNRGIVAAQGLVNLGHLVALSDIPGALWSVDSSGGTMTFQFTAPSLQGNIAILAPCGGHFVFQAHVTTCGADTRRTGSLTVEGAGPFRYGQFINTPGTCGNPGSPTGVGCDGDPLFEVVHGQTHDACCP